MNNIFKTLLFILVSHVVYGQETFQFQIQFQPKSSYKTNLEMNLNMKMHVSGSEKNVGINDLDSKMLMNFEMLTKTDIVNKEGKLPFEISYTDLVLRCL